MDWHWLLFQEILLIGIKDYIEVEAEGRRKNPAPIVISWHKDFSHAYTSPHPQTQSVFGCGQRRQGNYLVSKGPPKTLDQWDTKGEDTWDQRLRNTQKHWHTREWRLTSLLAAKGITRRERRRWWIRVRVRGNHSPQWRQGFWRPLKGVRSHVEMTEDGEVARERKNPKGLCG